jgi:hypothetical protein
MSDEKEKWKTLGFLKKKGQKEKVPVLNEDTGEVGGFHVKHWDGRQDAHVMPRGVKASGEAKVAGTEEEVN